MNTSPCFKDTPELRRSILDACLAMSELKFCISTWGNISVRVEGGIIVTPSRMEYGSMTVDDLVVVDGDGKRIAGHRLPSSETLLHCALQRARADLPVWIHTHPRCLSTLACRHRGFPVIVEDMAQITGGPVNCTEYVPGGRHSELARAAVEAIAPESGAVLLANHGVIVGGVTAAEALAATEVLEKAAAMWLAGEELIVPIPDELVREERNRYLYKYGRE